jgi:hypothetical protein
VSNHGKASHIHALRSGDAKPLIVLPRIFGDKRYFASGVVAAIALTTCGDEFRMPTERELHKCGYDFSLCMTDSRASDATFVPDDPPEPAESIWRQIRFQPHLVATKLCA